MKSKKPIFLVSLSGIIIASALGSQKPDFSKTYKETSAEVVYSSNVSNVAIDYNYSNPSSQRIKPNGSLSTFDSNYKENDNYYNEEQAIDSSINDKTNIETNEYATFIESVSNINVKYAYANYYNIDEAFNRTAATVSNDTSSLICDPSIIPSKQILKATITNNNNNFFGIKRNGYYPLSDERIDTVVDILYESLQDNFEILNEDSRIRVYEELSHLTVIGADTNNPSVSNSEYNAMYTENGILIIDENCLEKYYNLSDSSVKRTIAHEVAHIYQREYKEERSSYTRIGVSQYWNDLKVNPLIWKFINESTAESNSMKQFNETKPLVYSKYYQRLQTLNLVALINPNYDERAYENANMNFDTNAIFEIYNAKTYQEKVEIAEMLYSIDIIDSERGDFYTSYRGDDNREVLKVSLLSSAMFTNSRYFYTNLAERIENSNVSFEDIMYLIKVLETDLDSQLQFSTNPSRYQEFINKYTELQNEFFEYLSVKYNVSLDDLKYQYSIYASNSNITIPSLSWLDNDEKAFIINEYNMDQDYQNNKTISSYANQSGLSK